MSGKIKSRSAANADLISGGVPCDERILRDCHELYTEPDSAESVGVKLLPPRKKITVMLMGNHSAGKSSFINYVEEHIQRTGVAIETQGFSFVTNGRKRESLTGNATLHLYPHFKPLQEFKVSEYLSTEICTSRQKRFSLVTFVDSPGLVDGDMKYPFDVDEVILWLDLCDLILVFFDPMGQALCKRTLNIVESLNEKHGDRLRFYLSKADEAGGESDRQRVMMQIVQELCKRPGLNKCGFDMPTIYIPNPNKPSRCVNQIEEVCRTIEKTINQTVQNTLNSLERDCELIVEAIADKLSNDQTTVENRRARCKSCFLTLLGFCVPLTLLAFLVLGALSQDLLKVALGKEGTETLALYLQTPIVRIFDSLPVEQRLYGCAGLVLLSFLLLIIARFIFTRPTLSNKQKRQLQEKLEYIKEVVKTKKKKLYEEYLRQSVSDHDMG
uniref:Si:ch211-11k18.4 n=1 Tax=Amphilophus citrinellus TaxID=61819 RepID=A0A3Q0RDI5_AMPCI